MHIAFDCSGITCPSNSKRGIGRYARQHLITLLTENPGIQISLLHEPGIDITNLQEFMVYSGVQIASYDRFDFSKAKLLHLPDPMTIISDRPCLLPMSQQITTTILFHDLIPLILHTEHLDFFSAKAAREYVRRLSLIRENVAMTFTNSENTRQDLIRIAQVDETKTLTVHAGSHLAELIPSGGWKERLGCYFLAIGGLDSHKGFHHTMRAFITLRHEGLSAKLVVVGSTDDPYKFAYQQLAKESGIEDSLLFTGFVSDQELAGLLSEALALIYPSSYEGFGFPILEAMSQGCPVITAPNSSLSEVGGTAVLYIQNNDLAELMSQVFCDEKLRNHLSNQGKAQSKRFSWSKVTNQILRIWELL